MQVNIADLLDGMEPMLALEETDQVSSERVKEITMKKIHRETNRKRRWGSIFVIAAVLCTILCITASAGGWNPFGFIQLNTDLKEPGQQTERTLADLVEKAAAAKNTELRQYDDMGESVYSYSFEKALHRLFFYASGEIKMLDARDLTEEYRPEMTEEEATAYAAKAEAACPRVIDALHDDGYIKGTSSEIECCFCNDLAGADTIFNGDSVWVDVLMKDDSAYSIFLEPDTFACTGFVYSKPENMSVMYGGIFVAMRDGTEAQWWYDLQHAGGLG